MPDNSASIDDAHAEGRRTFLERTSAAAGIAGLTALAGCMGGESRQELRELEYVNNPQDYSPERHDAINLIADNLEEVGFDVDVNVLEWGTLFANVTEEHEYDFATWWTFFTIDPGILLPEYYHSENTDPGAGNFTGYENEELDELLDEQLEIADEEQRRDVLHEAQEILVSEVPQMPIIHMPNLVVHNVEQVTNWEADVSGFNSFHTMVNLEMVDGEDTLAGTWPEALDTMNVLGHNDESKHVYQFNVMYDRLVQLDDELEPVEEHGLAEDWEHDEDEDVVTYEIRDHEFHDGEELTADDVAFTFNYVAENEIPLYTVQNRYIGEAEAVDDRTVELQLEQPLGPIHTVLSSQIPIIPQHEWEDVDEPTQESVDEPVGSGVLEFDYWDRGEELGLVRNEDHWLDLDFERRFWRIIPETSTVWEMLLGGDLNYEPFGRISRQLDENREEPQIEVAEAAGPSWWHVAMNTRNEPLDDPDVRRAVVNAVPRTAIAEQLLYGFAEPGFNHVSEAFGDLHNPDVPEYEESIERAQERLEEAGYQ
ncbi:ABC transporter substrate-binding protein [Halovivax sp.]|uniref:ABC transporter substrate-binding protein n=1 Tax=Halovivax sp. TaxID=1935978 RepID=UPI0025BDCB20|nr:ABC transporter substrate-binding protein [Halovivax sp.]